MVVLKISNNAIASLIAWYHQARRPFPWRKDPHPYKVWVAEIMSQQTQINTLMPYYERFMALYPTVQALAGSSVEDVLKAWTGLGYYSRARNLHKGAQKIVLERNGVFPQTYDDWLQINGVGPYTAAAVSSQSFQYPRAVWDGNVLRVASRFFRELQPYKASFKEEALSSFEIHMKRFSASDINQGLMELGATICSVANPKCDRCPLKPDCAAYGAGMTNALPPPKARKKELVIEAGVIVKTKRSTGRLLVALKQRSSEQWYSGMWDFPTELGGVRNPIVPFSKQYGSGRALKTVSHSITHHRISLKPVLAFNEALETGERWFDCDDVFGENPSVPVSTTARKVMRTVSRCL